MVRDMEALISQMTLEEKASLCSGADFWHLKGVKRLGVPPVMVSDGPHGLRKQDDTADHLGINISIEAVCFPPACASACSFDRELLKTLGEALGEEAQAEDVAVVLGPAVNHKRSPLCGRNFEYFSEDPYLTGELAKNFVTGVQKMGVGTSLKHFAANNQEYHRMKASSEADERTLREIYLAAFETVVKEAKPWTVMCSYNKINGVYASENPRLLNHMLRTEWGFQGAVVSDWGAVNDRVEGLKAGLDLEMPPTAGYDTDRQIASAVKSGALSEAALDTAVERILRLIFRYADNRRQAVFDREKHHRLAVKIEEESAVLLKNDGGLLPLRPGQKIAFIGGFAAVPRFQGGGSSHINASRVTSALDAVKEITKVSFAKGFPADRDERDERLLREAVHCTERAEAAVIFAGLPDSFESEGYDRTHMSLPLCQNELIEAVARVQKNTVVVLSNGSPVELPWNDRVPAVLELYLGGQGVGKAAVNLLFGRANPSGKLAESFPIKLEDNPSHLYFPGDGKTAEYREGVFTGYRYYDKKRMAVRYPFGHGLSYTTFSYGNLRVDRESLRPGDTLTVEVDVKNTGTCFGKEVVELYVADKTGTPGRPEKELKGFCKLSLAPGEQKTARMVLTPRSFSWYNPQVCDWYHAGGRFEILIGKSSRDIVLSKTVAVGPTHALPFKVTENTTVDELLAHPATAKAAENKMMEYMATTGAGDEEHSTISPEFIRKTFLESPLRLLKGITSGLRQSELDELIKELNSLL